jgi:Tfp pilus assembly protein PilF
MQQTICVKGDTKAKNVKSLLLLCVSVLTHFAAFPLHAEESHPGLAVEAMYTEALLEFNKNNVQGAAKILDRVLRRDSQYLPALEMRALTLKISGDDNRAIDIYSQLIKLKPQAERGPYHYELATIYNKYKKFDLAKQHLLRCLYFKFNEVPSHLLYGTIAFNEGNYAEAEKSFSFVKSKAPDEIKLVAQYYLGLVNFRMGYGAIATAEILDARTLAQNLPGNKAAAGILTATDQILGPFQKSRWFTNLTLVSQYDSNAAQLPLGISNPVQLSGKSTPKINFSGGVGWMGAPLNSIQLVANYRLSTNKNMNSNTRSLEFVTNSLSVYANYRPLSVYSGGLRVDSNFIFQNQAESPSDLNTAYVYGKSSLTTEVGPFFRFFVQKYLSVQTDLYYRIQDSYLYPTQDGGSFGTRINFRANTVNLLFNPGWGINIEKSNAAGEEVRYLAYGASLSNSMRLSSQDTVSASIDFLRTNYVDSALGRSDMNFPFRMNWSHMFNLRWTLMCDFSYVINSSSIPDSYSYNRITTGLGIGWSL